MIQHLFSDFLRGYEVFIGFYALSYIVFYFALSVLSFVAIKIYSNRKHNIKDDILIKSNHVLGVSVVAPAYNEGANIVFNVQSLLSLNYPKFEVIIINDGSTDDTLDKLIKEFELVKVDFFYESKIHTQPVKGHYKSTNPVYSKLLVVDKENGKSKADASNAGINSAQYPLFLCTDVDCILRKDTIVKLAKPFMENRRRVIATGAAIRASNSCEVREGFLDKIHYPKNWLARFQELEYIRAFLLGRMAWSKINSLLLVSGGLGLFDKEIAIKAGGYWHKSLGEDMELITRMRKHMYSIKEDFIIQYIPESLCFTEVPATIKVLVRQRSRWGRGLIQTLYLHKDVFFNKKFGRMGFLIFPHFLLFEFLVPILEAIGIITLLVSFLIFNTDYEHLLLLSTFVYFFYLTVTLFSILWDEILYNHYANVREVAILIAMAFIEPFVYHPINIFATLKGYYHFFRAKEQKWGDMERQGFVKVEKVATAA
ncbi:glycosyltransferase family 2 protein [Litoribacter ruber]|uniref:Glycosyltransferase family 2 protein n=1 Tax=Litoribacter ruber TaxID=702568 RepID=A0AAP2CL81_9BACT|nr:MULTISPECIES: glycosyltransferase [Litoribacter]MBS9524625.1 glycosyltransferase family 2 protein [Litoribacter alkaliphilus]MBT0810217.1 glycosyltransferase family 2 protein [Litoribacter ruber]